MPRNELNRLFKPQSIAVYGASDTPGTLGQVVLSNLKAGGFTGDVVLVNPGHQKVSGQPCYATLAEAGVSVDMAVIMAPAATVPDIITDCGEHGVGGVIVMSAGFREAGGKGAALETEILSRARRFNLRMLGPNCLGIIRTDIGLNATFSAGNALPGRIAVVSQSGALCTAILDWARVNEVGFSNLISTGIGADVGFGEILDFVATDPQTDSIMLYIEGLRDARRFLSAMRAAARTKPVVVMKSGRHAEASRAAVSHTGALVGSDEVFDAAIRRAGALRVYDFAEFFSTAATLDSGMRTQGSRLAIITNAGGPGVMAADHCADAGLQLAELDAATLAELDRLLPKAWSHNNPVDILGDAGPDRFEAVTRICLGATGIDAALVVLTPQAQTAPLEVARRMVKLRKTTKKPVMACWMGSVSVQESRTLFKQNNFPVYGTPEAAIRAFAAIATYHENQQLLLQVPEPLLLQSASDVENAGLIIDGALAEGRRILSQPEAKAVLAAFHIPILPSIRAQSPQEAMLVAQELGFPVVMKIDSPDIAHKTDVGGVRLNLDTARDVRQAFRDLTAHVAEMAPEARIDGVVLEPMWHGSHGRELMVGLFRDEVFGPVVSFGLGGTLVEVLRDSAVALAPLNAFLARHLIDRTRASRLLAPLRGAPAIRRETVEDVLLRVSEMACELPGIIEMDLNPLIADPEGVVAVDARIVVAEHNRAARAYDHMAIHPYPRDLIQTIELADGTVVTVRPIRPEDAVIERDFVNGLSKQSRFFRFMASMREISPDLLSRFTQIDYDREMALVATIPAAVGERQIGVARYASLEEQGECEFAIVVGDDWQNRGLARQLMQALIEIARERRFVRMRGIVLRSNVRMLEFSQALGFRVETASDDPELVEIVLDL